MKHETVWKIGCSGFSYRDWKQVFYPAGMPSREWLSYYSSQFNTLESNTTFYHTPRPDTLRTWFEQTPPDFVFSVKAPRLITHYKKMVGTADMLKGFYDLMWNGLVEKLGCILFQFPPMFHFTTGRLDAILTQLDPSVTNVVEFRHRSWWDEAVYDQLRSAGISFCGISYPGLPDTIVQGFRTQYFRFHGVPELYRSSYSATFLDGILSTMKAMDDVERVYLYFNNTIAATAIGNAEYIQRSIGY